MNQNSSWSHLSRLVFRQGRFALMTGVMHHLKMPTGHWLVVPAFCLLMLSAAPRAVLGAGPPADNLVRNGGFDKLDAAESPLDWVTRNWSGSSQFSLDTEIGRTSKPSVRIDSQEPADASWSLQVTLKPRTDYRFTAWVRTDSVVANSGLGVFLSINELQQVGKSEALVGTHDWTLLTSEFNSGEHANVLLSCHFGGWGQSTGTAWFDDVQLQELGEALPTLTAAEADDFYVDKVKPILVDNCLPCHGEDPEDLGGGLALTSPQMITTGGDSGPAVNLENHSASLLLKAINHDVLEMPPDEKLSSEDIATLTLWVQLGIPWPEAERTEIEVAKQPLITEEAKQWWAFQPPVSHPLPEVQNATWGTNEIDRFVLSRLEENQFEPAGRAERATLIRRATYDLLGLPPTLAEVQAFVDDPDPQAYEKLIDRLLASPHYGEKWARHWLDLVRYAESNSFERDGTKPFVWRYRDYVIRSFNEDKPYDQFLLEQLAGDELPQPTPDSLIATGYYRLGQWDDEPADPQQARFDDLDDILGTTTQTMLGLTVNCARCHDHKIDPIPQSDYYKMLSFFNNIRRYGIRSHESVVDASLITIDVPEHAQTNVEIEAALQENLKSLQVIEEKVKPDFIPVEHEEFRHPMRRRELIKKRVGTVITEEEFQNYSELQQTRKDLQTQLNERRLDILCVKEEGANPRPTHLMVRGNAHVEGPLVEPGFISVLTPPEPEIPVTEGAKTSGRRLALARWIADSENPMTSRVMVNRIWQYHFGRGIVRTSSDFGFQGSLPTHPELLDWLATEFVANGWRMKPMHRKIMLSSTYQMATTYRADYAERDPENNLFWRFNMRRLTAEEIRDSILSVTRQLNLESLYGPSVYPELPAEVLAGQSVPGAGWETSSPIDQNRRSIYVHIKRSLRVPILSNYDSPDPDFTCPVRFETTQPTQALSMINSDFIQKQAALFIASLGNTDELEFATLVEEILGRVLQRVPTPEEVGRGSKLIEDWMLNDGLSRNEAIQNYCLLAMNLNEFVYLD